MPTLLFYKSLKVLEFRGFSINISFRSNTIVCYLCHTVSFLQHINACINHPQITFQPIDTMLVKATVLE